MATHFSFDQLRAQVNPTQQKILSFIWRHFSSKKHWVLTRVIHHQFGKEVVLEALKSLGGTIVYELWDAGTQRYQLTLLGICLTEQSDEILECFDGYLGYLTKRYLGDPENDLITSKEILNRGGLTEEQVRLLGKVLSMSPFWGGTFGGSDDDWNTRFPSEADEFPGINNFQSYVKAKLMEAYKQDVPVSERERAMRSNFGDGEVERVKERDQKFGIILSPAQAKLDFDEWIKELAQSQSKMAVLFLDIDNFKLLNTAYTETKVDTTILPDFMRLLNSLAIKRGEVYRYGGDEFLVVLPNHDVKESAVFSERLCSKVAGHTFRVDNEERKMTISIGVAHWPDDGKSYEEVLQKSNEAKREAKKQKNCVRIVSSPESTEPTVVTVGSSYSVSIKCIPKDLSSCVPEHKLLDQLIASSYSLPTNDFGRRMRWPLYKDRSNLVRAEEGWIGARLADEPISETFEISAKGEIRFTHSEFYREELRYVSLDRVLSGVLTFWPFLERFSKVRPGSYKVNICLRGILRALLSVDIGLVFAKDWIAKADTYETSFDLVLPIISSLERDNFFLQVAQAACSSFSPPRGVSIHDFREDYIKKLAEKHLARVSDASREDE